MSTSTTCTFSSRRGHDLSARLERPTGTVRATAVFAHCFTCSKDLKAARRLNRALAERGVAVLSFDFTGLGSSEGEFSATTFTADVADLAAAADYLAETIQAPSLLIGHSLGGAAVLAAAPQIPSVEAIATVGAPADVGHVAELFADGTEEIRRKGEAEVAIGGRQFTVGSSFLDDICDQKLLATLPDIDAALLFLHSPIDNVVGIDNARRLFEAARHPKSYVTLDTADHLLTDDRDARYAAEVIASWAERYLDDVPDEPSPDSYDQTAVVAVNDSGLAADVSTRGFILRVDEPATAGGTETGPTPYDYLGAALASCTSLTLRLYAERKGYDVGSISTSVSFDQVHADDCAACEHTDGRIERFSRTIAFGNSLDDDVRDRLVSIANLCPVHKTLEGQIEVTTTLADRASSD